MKARQYDRARVSDKGVVLIEKAFPYTWAEWRLQRGWEQLHDFLLESIGIMGECNKPSAEYQRFVGKGNRREYSIPDEQSSGKQG